MNICQAGHERHDRLMVNTVNGKMLVFDFDKYAGQEGIYCTGQDDISRTLKNEGVWGYGETKEVKELLERGNKNNLVIDFGAHIGYYTLMAAKMGYTVMAIEGNTENLELLLANTKLHDVADKVVSQNTWVDSEAQELNVAKTVELVKIDLEGNEQYAIKMLMPMLKKGLIKHLFVEISPVFNDSYPYLVGLIEGLGYNATVDGQPFDGDFNFSQENFLFTKKP